jgi:GNAT superfamily N-acetyltransferase
VIRRLHEADWEGWLPLWHGYLDFYREPLPDEITRVTFRRLCNGEDGMQGLIAIDDDSGDAIGLAHIVFHPYTWNTVNKCYLEDLFVARGGRGAGTAQRLIEAVYAEADASGCESVYWHTQQFNAPARSLYDRVAHNTSFIVYERDRPS